MKTRGTSLVLFTIPLLGACGAAATPQPAATPVSSATTTSAEPKAAAKETPAEQPKPEATAETTPAEAATAAEKTAETPALMPDPTPEPCDGDWICVRVPLEGKGKVEKRETKLIGDPKIEATWSQNTDGRAAATFGEASVPVDLVLRRLPGKPGQHLAQIVLKAKGREIVIDKRDGGEFGYVGFIAAEKDGAFLVDLRYMK